MAVEKRFSNKKAIIFFVIAVLFLILLKVTIIIP